MAYAIKWAWAVLFQIFSSTGFTFSPVKSDLPSHFVACTLKVYRAENSLRQYSIC